MVRGLFVRLVQSRFSRVGQFVCLVSSVRSVLFCSVRFVVSVGFVGSDRLVLLGQFVLLGLIVLLG